MGRALDTKCTVRNHGLARRIFEHRFLWIVQITRAPLGFTQQFQWPRISRSQFVGFPNCLLDLIAPHFYNLSPGFPLSSFDVMKVS